MFGAWRRSNSGFALRWNIGVRTVSAWAMMFAAGAFIRHRLDERVLADAKDPVVTRVGFGSEVLASCKPHQWCHHCRRRLCQRTLLETWRLLPEVCSGSQCRLQLRWPKSRFTILASDWHRRSGHGVDACHHIRNVTRGSPFLVYIKNSR